MWYDLCRGITRKSFPALLCWQGGEINNQRPGLRASSKRRPKVQCEDWRSL